MNTRREFLKQTGIAGGAAAAFLSQSIQRALAIEAAPGSTFFDAEHVVILMQENRSFDHLYGALRGVRGFGDPRAIDLPSGNPGWFQTNAKGETYAPFRLDIKNTKVTWLGSLPHSWTDQVDARNNGKCDRWLEAKKSGHKECQGMPFTMGAFTREDLPFYYELADAFTVCDQHFCSSLTGTMANRVYLWTGTVRGVSDASARARLNNGDVEYENSCAWKTFPERLEDLGVSWKVYQNEISSLKVGFQGEEEAWLANFGDNPLEWFPQHHAGFSAGRQAHLRKVAAGEGKEAAAAREQLEKWSDEKFASLSQRARNLHTKANVINDNDPDFHKLTSIKYKDDDTERQLQIPKGDVLKRFRDDVANGQLPAVSWLVAPENFSDHPGAAWYGAWYVSEVLNILTQNPAVWKKTIFILTYDENDGYFDHVPPFVAPHPRNRETGATSASIKTDEDFVTMEEEVKVKEKAKARESSIGLGYRVPLVVASPWSRGGYVCSQVYDHTSPLQLMEKWLSKRLGKPVEETNISGWRRAVCGDLTACFRPAQTDKQTNPNFLRLAPFAELIHKAKFKPGLSGFRELTQEEINRDGAKLVLTQEPGIRPSCALPYQLSADATFDERAKTFEIAFAASTEIFGERSAGAGFNVYAPGKFRNEVCRAWAFATLPGEQVKYSWPAEDFEAGKPFLRVYGPNGFFREFRASPEGAPFAVQFEQTRDGARVVIRNVTSRPVVAELSHHAYRKGTLSTEIAAWKAHAFPIEAGDSGGWFDWSIRAKDDANFEARYAGRLETGKESISDPLIGGPAAKRKV